MLIDSYKQESNYKREYKLINVNEGIDLIPFIDDGNLSYSKFEQEKDGSMSANSMSFTLTFPYNMIVIDSVLDILYIDDSVLTDLYIDDSSLINLEQPLIVKKMSLDTIIKKGDNISFIETTENCRTVFEGIVELVKLKRDNISAYLSIEVKDRTYSLYEMKHAENKVFQNMYLSNSENPTKSLIHQIAYKLGFTDDELDLQNFNYIIPFVYFEKDQLIIKELAEAVRLVGGVFTIEENKLTIRTEMNIITENYIFDKRNILSEINKDPEYSNYEKMKITYGNYFEKQKQDMWILVGENGNLNDANIVVRAGKKRQFSVSWLYNVDLVRDYELYEVEFTDVSGNHINFNYALNIDETGGTLELDNSLNNYDVYVKKFKIKGIPLFMQDGNQSYYPSNIESEKLLDNCSNKFVQNPDLALTYLKANYNLNCKSLYNFSFTTNVNNYLEPCRKIWLEHVDYTGWIFIEKIDFQGTKMSIQAREYLEPVNLNDIKTLEKSNVDELEVISNKYMQDVGVYDKDKPLIPKNLLLVSEWLGFDVIFDEPLTRVRGHYLYIKKDSEVDFQKIFINTNKYFYPTGSSSYFNIKVSAISTNGVESDTTEIKNVKALEVPVIEDNKIIAAINASGEEVSIEGRRINVGSGLVVENGKVVVRELDGENIKGKKLEGLEIVSENIEKTERIYINYGKVVHQKRNTMQEEYKNYEQLTMMKSGEVICPNSWSEIIDFKLFNNDLPWSNLNITAFIGAQYDLNTNGIAISNYIIKEWVGAISEQKMRFKVAGSSYVNTNRNFSTYYSFSNQSLTITNVKSLSISMNLLSPISHYNCRGGSHSNNWFDGYMTGKVNVYLKKDQEAEILIGSTSHWYICTYDRYTDFIDNVSYNNTYSNACVITIRYELVYCNERWKDPDYAPINYASEQYLEEYLSTSGISSKSGNVVEQIRTDNTIYNATVNWIAIGNS